MHRRGCYSVNPSKITSQLATNLSHEKFFWTWCHTHTIQPVCQQGSPHFMMRTASQDDNAPLLVPTNNVVADSDLNGSTISKDAVHYGNGDMHNGNVTNITFNISCGRCPDPTAHLPKQASSQPTNCFQRPCRYNRILLIAILQYLVVFKRGDRKCMRLCLQIIL